MRLRAPIISLVAVLCTGCTATLSTYSLVSADEALRRAEELQAEELAPYEYTLALLYLDKAREEAGYSDYRAARELASEAASWADEAVIQIQKGKVSQAIDELQDLPDRPREERAPPDLDNLLDEEERRRDEHGVDIDELLEEELGAPGPAEPSPGEPPASDEVP